MQVQTRELVQGQPVLSVVGGLFRHKVLFMGLLTGVLSLVAAVTLMAKQQYRSEMKFWIKKNRTTPATTPARSPAPAPAEIPEPQLNSELEVLDSEDVLGA